MCFCFYFFICVLPKRGIAPWIQLYLTSKIRLQFPVVVCKDLKAGILVSLQQQQKWGLVLDLPKMQATFTNIGKEVTLELHKTREYKVE